MSGLPMWAPGRLYQPGATVQPTLTATAGTDTPDNPGFESGNVGWTAGGDEPAGWAIAEGDAFQGDWRAAFTGAEGGTLTNDNIAPVVAGQSVTARCYVQPQDSAASGRVGLAWFDESDVLISTDFADDLIAGASEYWRQSEVEATAPATAAGVAVVLQAESEGSQSSTSQTGSVAGGGTSDPHYFTVPSGMSSASFTMANADVGDGTGADNLDLQLYADIGFGFEFVADSTGPESNEEITVPNPLPGQYAVFVVGTSVVGPGAVSYRIFNVNSSGGAVLFDSVTWDYASQGALSELIFRAVFFPGGPLGGTQAVAGTSGASEPVWPTVAGNTVDDNELRWLAVTADRVVWRMFPILTSGATEPTWPEQAGAFVADGTISWEAITRQVTDKRCPASKVVEIAASKVFAADGDIIPFSATINPLNWSAPDDSGYLPFGLQTHGSMPVAAMGLYRGNLIAFNAAGFQMWQVD